LIPGELGRHAANLAGPCFAVNGHRIAVQCSLNVPAAAPRPVATFASKDGFSHFSHIVFQLQSRKIIFNVEIILFERNGELKIWQV
jgi:hypothetical protein